MQTILGLKTGGYKITDITKAKEWYAKTFNSEPYFDQPFYVDFNIAGYELCLQHNDSIKGDNIVTYCVVEKINTVYKSFLSLLQ